MTPTVHPVLSRFSRFSRDSVVLILAISIGTAGGAQSATAPGVLVDIGGQRVHVNCTGRGSPTVVLESGLGDVSTIWAAVQRDVSTFTRVCSYDRGGYASSDPGVRPRTFVQLALELHTALDRLRVGGPYLLVGQSYGGLVVRGFAARYRREIAGMVLVDAVHEDQRVVYGGQPHRIRDDATGRTAPSPRIALDTALVRQARAASQQLLSLAQQAETDWSPEELQRMHDARLRNRVSLDSLPLIVLARTRGEYDDGMSISADSLERERRNLQADLARLSYRGTLVFAEHSGHNIHVDAPDLVIGAIRRMVNEARR